MSPQDAIAWSYNCDGVIYYGKNISPTQAAGDARVLRNHEGLNVISVGGSPNDDGVIAIVRGQFVGAYTESQLLQGEVAGKIVTANTPSQVASLEQP